MWIQLRIELPWHKDEVASACLPVYEKRAHGMQNHVADMFCLQVCTQSALDVEMRS